MTDKRKVGIYIHIPFCQSKCFYCDFCSLPGRRGEMIDAYVSRLCREIEEYSVPYETVADTVYFGGGTPSLLGAQDFSAILDSVRCRFSVVKDCEITAECNPKTVDRKKLSEMQRAGVNRLSIGMQSVHDVELKALGRIHSYADFLRTFSDAREAGFDNISVDLMYGIPRQSRESFEESLYKTAELHPEHISSYCLKIEEGTRFFERRNALSLPDEDCVCDMYDDMGEILGKYGYHKYEISNFSLPGRESAHNLKYWKYDDYLGFGAAAHSFFDGVRYFNSDDVEGYIAGKNIRSEGERISYNDAVCEYVMLGMRLSRGVDKKDFFDRFGKDFDTIFSEKFKKYQPLYVKNEGGRCFFTDRGMFVSNTVLSDVLDFEDA